ncbi:aspartyl protease family protein 1 isoform X1 [Silene latifolia]|uniref:aspartyl protease family protein 1 isoform X1 n=3 Tax=Silene latifolia TaxID=37657 RepID=UPI003D7848D7
MSFTFRCSSTNTRGVFLLVLILGWTAQPIYGYGTFGFDIHHRFSDPVKRVLDSSELPEKGTVEYYAAMAHRDAVIHGRRLSSSSSSSAAAAKTPLTFSSGNTTHRISLFGFLQYANVTVGTPAMWFLVALDTGSDLFWLPCDCDSCVKGVRIRSQELDFNIYSPSTSSTGTKVPCNSSLCGHRTSCSGSSRTCDYSIMYLSANTSSSGYLVEDVLHLVTDDTLSKPVRAKVPFGCGEDQTGSFLDGGAPNGLLGLGLKSISVPSILASRKVAVNSFSMCFGDDGTGRITFGDQGSSDQSKTPFIIRQLTPHYNISIEQIIVGGKTSKVDGVYAIFDSGTSFTYLNDPAYALIAENFDSMVTDSRHSSDPDIPFEYCYDLSSIDSSPSTPPINLTMKGGDQLYVIDPTVTVSTQTGDVIYCLGIVKSEGVNIIGQNFMTGYRVVFDREKMVLGWKASDCNYVTESNTLPISPQGSAKVSPIASVEPQATPSNSNHMSGAAPTWSISHLHFWTCTLIFSFLQALSFFS